MFKKIYLSLLLLIPSVTFADYSVRFLGSTNKTILELANSLDTNGAKRRVSLSFNASGLGRVNADFSVRKQIVDGKPILLLSEERGSSGLHQRYLSGAIFKDSDKVTLHLYAHHFLDEKSRAFKIVGNISNLGKIKARTFSRPSASLGNIKCGNDRTTLKLNEGGDITSEIVPQTAAATDVKILEVTTGADNLFKSVYGSSSNSQITSIINAASAIYTSQLGIEIRVSNQIDWSGSTNDSSGILSAWRDYGNSTGMVTGNVDAGFLFSGEDFDGTSGSTIGLAYLGVTCEYTNYAYGIVQHVASSLDHVIFAHELGHNLSAEHSTSGSIMGASLGNPAPSSFSSGSISQIGSWVNSQGSCMTSGNSSSPSPTATPTGGNGGGGNDGGGGSNTSPTATPAPSNVTIALDNVRVSGGKTIKGTILISGANQDCDIYLWGGKSSTVFTTVLKSTVYSQASYDFTATVSKKPDKDIYFLAEADCDQDNNLDNNPISSSKRMKASSIKSSSKVGQTAFLSHVKSKVKLQ